jgi:probable addiction module antidote protein
MAITTRPFDMANYIDTAADQADLLSDAVDSGDPRYIAYALGAVARARGGIAKLAREAGMNRQALHKALSEDGNPTLDTVLKVLRALGLHMRIEEGPGEGDLEAAE